MIPTSTSSKAPAARAYRTFNNTCLDCEHPEEKTELPDDKLTDQCTDQCVVIACDDPEHASMCRGAGDLAHCDFDCDAAVECTDCNGFDAFVSFLLSSCGRRKISSVSSYNAATTTPSAMDYHQIAMPQTVALCGRPCKSGAQLAITWTQPYQAMQIRQMFTTNITRNIQDIENSRHRPRVTPNCIEYLSQ